MEVNPLAGLHPTHSDLPMIGRAFGVSYVELIGRILQSAAQRVAISSQLSAVGRRKLTADEVVTHRICVRGYLRESLILFRHDARRRAV